MFQIRGDDGQWRDLPGFVRAVIHTDTGSRHYPPLETVPVERLLALPTRVDSDSVTVSLADDATWQHFRSLCPPPERLEGR